MITAAWSGKSDYLAPTACCQSLPIVTLADFPRAGMRSDDLDLLSLGCRTSTCGLQLLAPFGSGVIAPASAETH